MSLLRRLLRALGYGRLPRGRPPRQLTFDLEDEWLESLENISEREQRSTAEVASDLLEVSLERHQEAKYLLKLWRKLSPREKEITALVCLGYTNPQIAAHLKLSVETVKTHVTNIREKYNVRSKSDLRVLLADWDFSGWYEEEQ